MIYDVKKLNDQDLEKVGGGYTFDAGCWAGDKSKNYEVIDDGNGNVLGRYSSMEEAKKLAEKKGQSTKEITSWSELYRLRDTSKR